MLLVIAWRLQLESVVLIRQALGGARLTLERLHAPASLPELAPRPTSGNPDVGGTSTKPGEQGQKDEKVNGCLEEEG